MVVRNARQRNGKLKKNAERPNDPEKCANDESESDEPTSRGAHEQKIRNELRKQQNFHEDVDQSLSQRIPRPGNEYDHAASCLGRNNHEPKIREHSEGGRGERALELERGLYRCVKY